MSHIAIIGLSCLFPDAHNPEQFWQNLINERISINQASKAEVEFDSSFFCQPDHPNLDQTYSLQGGYIRNFEFCPEEYKLPVEVLGGLDKTFQWSLYAAKEAINNSGYKEEPEVLRRCGVILGNLSFPTQLSQGLFSPLYQKSLTPVLEKISSIPDQSPDRYYNPSNGFISSLPAAVIAQALGLSNIHFCLDAACSSAFYAIKLASHYLTAGKADLMLAGAVSAADALFVRMLFAGVRGLSPNHLTRPLNQSSPGLIPGDGVGMVMLKRYEDALRDEDEIWGVITGVGLSNDGKGKGLLVPNPKGQVLAYERAYQEAKISPSSIDYLECHATGTLLGDKTELKTISDFFQPFPLIGSAKANTGHLLTAAGMVGLTKVLLGMKAGVIPPTVNIECPLSEQVVTKMTAWTNPVKQAAISAFGFGGNNSHLVIEQNPNRINETVLTPVKLAITGMDALFGGCDGLDEFERTVYNGLQHFIPLPEKRWLGESISAPRGAYIKDFSIDPLAFKIPPDTISQLNPQQLLLLKVAHRAIEDAGLHPGMNVAVIVGADTELSVHELPERWNMKPRLRNFLAEHQVNLSVSQLEELEKILKDSIHHPVECPEYVSYIGNITASRIAAIWDFTGPAFTITAGENSTVRGLEVAQLLLSSGSVEAVVLGGVDLAGGIESVFLHSQMADINQGVNTLSFDEKVNGWMVGEGAGAVVLQSQEGVAASQRVYAVVDAIAIGDNFPTICEKAFDCASISAEDISYLEVNGSGIPGQDTAEIASILQSYGTGSNNLHCAIGSIKANIGHTYIASGMASLIKTALCLYHRYIPATPGWSGVKNPSQWENSPFYVATESRPWFLNTNGRRFAAINSLATDSTCGYVILSGSNTPCTSEDNRYLSQYPIQLFVFTADSEKELLQELQCFRDLLITREKLSKVAAEVFTKFQNHQKAYTLAIIGSDQESLVKQITAAEEGIKQAFSNNTPWQSPQGSYFTPCALGKSGKLAYVYPAAVNSYLYITRTIHRLFPELLQDIEDNGLYHRATQIEQLIYPRSLSKLSPQDLEKLEQKLLSNPLAMFESEIAVARYLTKTLEEKFKIRPEVVFGYSLGETSMMVAQGVWSDFVTGSEILNSSLLFSDQLSGRKQAVREFWKTDDLPGDFWVNYLLMADVDRVRSCVEGEERVYLTQINTHKEVLIAGERRACERIINKLGCPAFIAPFDHVIHCPPTLSQHSQIAEFNSLPSRSLPGIRFYSAAEYKPIVLERDAIAQTIATALCQSLDFPRLVNTVYGYGARIFIEAGAGSSCCRWIDKILQNQEHLSVSVNRRGTDDFLSILKALAKLVSHQVPMDLSSLYDFSKPMQHLEQLVSLAKNKMVEPMGEKIVIKPTLYTPTRSLTQKLGDPLFLSAYKVARPYMVGAMARGITSTEMVIALGKAQMLGSFGAGGLSLLEIERAINRIQQALPNGPYAFNLIHNPNHPEIEKQTVELYLKNQVTTIEASAFLDLTINLVYYRIAGLSLGSDGRVKVNHKIIAKISRPEIARKFLSPPPSSLIKRLVEQGLITPEQAKLAEQVPMADDITVEGDSGGHTDNRPLICLLPAIISLRDELNDQFNYSSLVRIGAAGGIGTPEAVLAAFMMGAAYVVTGSINQACVEAGTSEAVKKLLAEADMADVAMAPAADMFEMGVKLQVLKRGTMFPMRSHKLYEVYRAYNSLEEIPPEEREKLEQQVFHQKLSDAWEATANYLAKTNPEKLGKALNNPKLKMSLTFRSYLGQSSQWAIAGHASRQLDYQIWCGPAMGSFNNSVKNTPLADPKNRRVVDIADYLLNSATDLYNLHTTKTQNL